MTRSGIRHRLFPRPVPELALYVGGARIARALGRLTRSTTFADRPRRYVYRECGDWHTCVMTYPSGGL